MKPQALAQSNKLSLYLASLKLGAVFSFYDKKVLDAILFQKYLISCIEYLFRIFINSKGNYLTAKWSAEADSPTR